MRKKIFWTEGAGSYVIAILIALTVRWAFVEPYQIPTGSMLPTLLIRDHIFVNKLVYGLRYPFTEKWIYQGAEPERGDVIVFKYPENNKLFYVKRVIGVPGDKVFYENNSLYINDRLIEKTQPTTLKKDFAWVTDDDLGKYINKSDVVHWQEIIGEKSHSIMTNKQRTEISSGPFYVPKDSYFVMGDNRDSSQDSRFWTAEKRFVPRSYLVGRAGSVWLSCDKTLPVLTMLCNPLTVRWKRLFHSVR